METILTDTIKSSMRILSKSAVIEQDINNSIAACKLDLQLCLCTVPVLRVSHVTKFFHHFHARLPVVRYTQDMAALVTGFLSFPGTHLLQVAAPLLLPCQLLFLTSLLHHLFYTLLQFCYHFFLYRLNMYPRIYTPAVSTCVSVFQ